jgi:hypothetical protein
MWYSFIKEEKLDIEWMLFEVGKKNQFFVLIGAWSKVYPRLTLRQIWRQSIEPPKLCIATTTRCFAARIGEMDLSQATDPMDEAKTL